MKNHNVKRIAVSLAAAAALALSAAANATVIDLTGNNNSGTTNGAQFRWTPGQPTGTGVIEPFVRIQADGTEQGYNTSGGTPFDEKPGTWTHDIRRSDQLPRRRDRRRNPERRPRERDR